MSNASSSSSSSNGFASFPSLTVDFNSDGWGPSHENLPEKFAMLPFATFNRTEKIGKAADFGGYLRNRGNFRRGMDENTDLAGSLYEAGDSAFITVDTAKINRNRGQGNAGGGGGNAQNYGNKNQQNNRNNNMNNNRNYQGGGGRDNAGRGWEDRKNEKNQGTSFNKRYNKLTKARWTPNSGGNNPSGNQRPGSRVREGSVRVSADWLQLEVFDLVQLNKLQTAVPEAQDLRWAGSLETYDEDFDNVNTRRPIKLRNFQNKLSKFAGATNDPIIESLAEETAGNVYVTDTVLSHLMASSRSVYPWDIVITYIGGTIFLDVRSPDSFAIHTVNENSHNPPAEDSDEDMNGRRQLGFEATVIHHDFTQQVLTCNSKPNVPAEPPSSGEPKSIEPYPFFDPEDAEGGEEPASVAFRYRRFNVGKDIQLVTRTTIHAVQRKKPIPQYINIYTLNEGDAKISNTMEWRQTMDSQRGSVLSTEMRNNSLKLAKFTVQSLLSGASSMKLGFVSRTQKNLTDSHHILGVHTLSPITFAHQMSLEPTNMWGILKWLIELIRKHAANLRLAEVDETNSTTATPDSEYVAKFVLLRDPNHARVYLYNVPFEAFETEENEEEEEEWVEDEDETLPGGGNTGNNNTGNKSNSNDNVTNTNSNTIVEDDDEDNNIPAPARSGRK